MGKHREPKAPKGYQGKHTAKAQAEANKPGGVPGRSESVTRSASGAWTRARVTGSPNANRNASPEGIDPSSTKKAPVGPTRRGPPVG